MAASKSAKKVVKKEAKADPVIKDVLLKTTVETDEPASDLTVLQKLDAQERLELEKIKKQPVNTEAVPSQPKGVLPNGMERYYDNSLKMYGVEKADILKKLIQFNPKRYKRIS